MNRIRAQIILTAVAILMPWASVRSNEMASQASEKNVQYLNITLKSSSVSFALADEPKMTYEEDVLSFYTIGEIFQIPVADIQEWSFSDVSTKIVETEVSKPIITPGKAYLKNLKPNSCAEIYNAKGERMLTETVNSDGEAILEFGTLPHGVYVIKTVAYTIKMIINKK